MSESWPNVMLGDVLKTVSRPEPVVSTKEYRLLGVRLDGGGPFLRETKLGSQSAATTLFKVETDDFIYSRLFAWRGAFGIISSELDGCYVSSEFPIFHPVAGKIDMKFLYLWFRLPRTLTAVEAVCTGSTPLTRNRFKEAFFLKMKLPLPSLVEQSRIVARIDELAAKIEEAKWLRREAIEEATVLLESGVGIAFERLSDAEYQPLKALTTKIGSGSTPSGGRASYPSFGVPFIRSLNVRMRQFQWDGIAYIDEPTHATMRGTTVKPNDVLLNITGASIGRVACAPPELETANVNQHVAIIRPRENVNSQYLMYWLSQPSVQDFINEEQKGATRQGFTKAQIEAFEVPLVSLPEQVRTVAYLDGLQAKVDVLKALQAETAAELAALLPSVLDRAFSGRL